MHSSATRVLYAFDQTPSLRVRERGLARETTIALLGFTRGSKYRTINISILVVTLYNC